MTTERTPDKKETPVQRTRRLVQEQAIERLAKPARVGGTIFGVGVETRLVIDRAQREFEYHEAEKDAAPWEKKNKIGEFLEQVALPSSEVAKAPVCCSPPCPNMDGCIVTGCRAQENKFYVNPDNVKSALLYAQSALRRWTALYARLQNECGEAISRKLDYNLPPADHLRALEAIDAALSMPSATGDNTLLEICDRIGLDRSGILHKRGHTQAAEQAFDTARAIREAIRAECAKGRA